jgi:anti-sigma factor RsiW
MTEPCRTLAPQVSAYVDGELSPTDAHAFARHVDTCAACRGLVQDLQRLRKAARTLGPIAPASDLWTRLQHQLPSDPPSVAAAARPRLGGVWWLAATAVVALGAAAWLIDRRVLPSSSTELAPSAIPAGNAAPLDAVETAVAEIDRAAQPYAAVLLELERSAADVADTGLARVLRAQLDAADRAIAAGRAALAIDPESTIAREALVDALRRKHAVIDAAGTLLQEVQRLDPERAARAAVLLTKG